jgi:very-short-patch-repair endonuclease
VLTAAAIDARLARGDLRAVFRGVYAPGHAALRAQGRWLAATLVTGGVLSHGSAARLWEMRVGAHDAVHVTTAAQLRGPAGVVVHRSRTLTAADLTRRHTVPVTTVARTLVDLAGVLTYGELRKLADHGVRLDSDALRRAQARAGATRGARTIARLLGEGDLRTRSGLERALLSLCAAHGLSRPRVNARVLGCERDAVWSEARLVVEVDGHAFHAPRGARQDDHERDAELTLAGWRVLRFTDDQIGSDPSRVAATIAAALRPR